MKARGWQFFESIGKPQFIMAPMVDQSELAFRQLCRRYNTHLCYTPMMSAEKVAVHGVHTQGFSTCTSDRPLIAQFSANDPDMLLKAAMQVEGAVDAIDLNLGCPQGIAKHGHYGAYLLEEPELICKMVRTVSANSAVPITCKMRLVRGPLQRSLDLACRLEEAGCSMLAVHGRRVEQTKDNIGACDWEAIRQIKRALNIPVIANGGVGSLAEALEAQRVTEAAGVMVAEALLADPRLFVGGCRTWQQLLQVTEEYVHIALSPPTPPAIVSPSSSCSSSSSSSSSTSSTSTSSTSSPSSTSSTFASPAPKSRRSRHRAALASPMSGEIRGHLFKLLHKFLRFPDEDLRPWLSFCESPTQAISRVRDNLAKLDEQQIATLWNGESWYDRFSERRT